MNRRKSRERALQILYQHDFTGSGTDDHTNDFLKAGDADRLDGFAGELVKGTLENLEEIDRTIQQAAEHWKVDRMAAVDRNILRFAVYEILYRKDIPSPVTINEALEIAKKYSSADSASFINGLLDRIARLSGREK